MGLHQPAGTLDPLVCGCDGDSGLLSVDAALARGLALCAPIAGTEDLAPAQAIGRVLARDIAAPGALPPFDAAAMDGYALRLSDLAGAGPWRLRVGLRAQAGDAPAALPRGAAARILTGAALPAGADAVVAQEDCRRDHGHVTLDRRPAPGAHIRRKGEDIDRGAPALPAGRPIGAAEAGLIGALRLARVAVRRRLRVAVIATGSEVGSRGPGGIGDADTPILAAALAQPWIDAVPPLHVPDDPAEIRAALACLAGRVDMIVTTGGVSVGDADHVPAAIRAAGGRIALSGVAMKPGKPLALGRVGGALWLGLPGNPVAVHVGWRVFGLALAARLAGLSQPPARKIMARLAAPVAHRPGRCEFRPARLLGYDAGGAMAVECHADGGSHRIAQLAGADALALIPGAEGDMPAGALVELLL